jgi:hypothetical protein
MGKTLPEFFAPGRRQSQAAGYYFERIEWPVCLLIETVWEFLLAVGMIFRLNSITRFDERECDD